MRLLKHFRSFRSRLIAGTKHGKRGKTEERHRYDPVGDMWRLDEALVGPKLRDVRSVYQQTMHLKTIFPIIVAIAVVITAISCSKSPAEKPVKDLGVVELLESTPKHLSLAEGKAVTLTTTILQDGNLEFVFKSESRTALGLPTRVEQKFSAPAGKKIMTSVDGVVISFTPTLKAK